MLEDGAFVGCMAYCEEDGRKEDGSSISGSESDTSSIRAWAIAGRLNRVGQWISWKVVFLTVSKFCDRMWSRSSKPHSGQQGCDLCGALGYKTLTSRPNIVVAGE